MVNRFDETVIFSPNVAFDYMADLNIIYSVSKSVNEVVMLR